METPDGSANNATKSIAKRYDDAIQVYLRQQSFDPQNPLPLVNIAVVYQEMGQLDTAAESCQSALSLDPKCVRAYSNLSVIYLLQRRIDEAIIATQEAIRLDPTFPNGFFNLGNAFMLREEWEQSVAAFQKAVELKPDWLLARKAYADALARAERTDEAITEYYQLVHCEPKDPEIWMQLGANLYLRALKERSRRGVEAAKDAMEQAHRIDPHLPQINELLSDVKDTLKIRFKFRLPWQKK